MHIYVFNLVLFHSNTHFYIQGGSVVLIHNLKHEIYLSGQGSIASDFLKQRSEVEMKDAKRGTVHM